MALELLLIRHGESEANAGLSMGSDSALTEKGLEQAHMLAHRVAAYDLTDFAGLTSPYRRASQTADQIAAVTGLSFAVEEGIREWGAATTINGRHYPVEPPEQLIERLKDFIRRYDGRKLVVASHAAPIAVLTHLAWGETPIVDDRLWLPVGNCCLRWLKTTCAKANEAAPAFT